MKKIVAIIAGDPNSINSEIIGKTWKKKSKFKNTNILILGNYILIKKQFKKLGFKFGVKQIKNFDKQDFNKNLLIYNIPLKFKNIFKIPASDKASHILSCFDVAIRLVKMKKISGLEISEHNNSKRIINRKNHEKLRTIPLILLDPIQKLKVQFFELKD